MLFQIVMMITNTIIALCNLFNTYIDKFSTKVPVATPVVTCPCCVTANS